MLSTDYYFIDTKGFSRYFQTSLEALFEVSENHFLVPRLAQRLSWNQNEMEKILPHTSWMQPWCPFHGK